MHQILRFVVAIAVVAVVSTSGVGMALADPINNPLAVHFALTCGGQEFTVVSANEPTATVHIVGETDTLVATEATLVTTFTDPQTGETVTDSLTAIFGAGNGEVEGLQGSLTTCTHTLIVEDPDVGPVTFELTGTFVMTPNN